MKKFIINTIAFGGIVVTFLIAVIFSVEAYVCAYADFKINQNIHYIVLGHSNAEFAFNDSLTTTGKNLAASGESYFYTYSKLKCLLNQNHQIRTVFVEFSNNQIAQVMDDWIWGNKNINYRYSIYSPFLSLEDKYLLIFNNPKEFLNSLSLALKVNCRKLFARDFNYIYKIGGFHSIKFAKLDSLEKFATMDRSYYKCLKYSTINIFYLKKIVKLCKERNVKIILMRSPKYHSYPWYENEKAYQKIRFDNFGDIPYYDFSKFPLDKYDFVDYDHLNAKGAYKFSSYFVNKYGRL